MIRFSKIFLGVTILLLLLWQLPWCYSFFTASSSKSAFCIYSTLRGEFIAMGFDDAQGKFIRQDESGNDYTQEQTDSLLPFFYVRQLMADERFPDTINGTAVTPREVQVNNFNFRASAQDFNAPKIGLYPLLESMSKRVELSMPDDVFRITSKRMEFVKMETNSIDEQKSELFTSMLRKKGFVFPATEIAGNPSARKEYDEGYLILDKEGKLFHVKMTKGRPYVRSIELPEGLKLKHLFVTEFTNRETLGYLTDADNRFYVLLNKSYEVIKTGVESYDPEKDGLLIFGNMFDWTVRVTTDKEICYYALSATDFSLIRKKIVEDDSSSFSILSFTSYKDKFVKPRFF